MADATFRDTLTASAAELGIEPDLFYPLDATAGAAVAAAVEERFGDAANGAMVGWWHSDRPCSLPATTRCFRDGRGWAHLTSIAPDPTERVWLLAENCYRGKPSFFVFAGTPATVQAVLGNTHGFEYIVVSQQLGWLFAEDHHDCVMVAGAEAVRRFEAIPK